MSQEQCHNYSNKKQKTIKDIIVSGLGANVS